MILKRSLRTIAMSKPNGTPMMSKDFQKMRGLDIVLDKRTIPPLEFEDTAVHNSFSKNITSLEKTLRNKIRALSGRRHMFADKARIVSSYRYFSERVCGDLAFTLLRRLNTGIILGDMSLIEETCIPQLVNEFSFLKGTIPQALQKGGIDVFNSRITKLQSMPEFVDCAVIQPGTMSSTQRFAQVTIEVLTEQKEVTREDPLMKKYLESNYKRGRPRVYESKPKMNTWQAVETPNGLIYYWHPGLNKVQWEKPLDFGLNTVSYDSRNGTLGNFGEIIKSVGKDRFIVKNTITLQKPLFNESDWLISGF